MYPVITWVYGTCGPCHEHTYFYKFLDVLRCADEGLKDVTALQFCLCYVASPRLFSLCNLSASAYSVKVFNNSLLKFSVAIVLCYTVCG